MTLGQQSILVGSCYLPPPATVPPGLFLPCVAHGLPCIIGGDFNGHHVWWSSGNPNEAGDQLQEAVDQAGFEIAGLEVDVPLATFPSTGGRPDLQVYTGVAECGTTVTKVHASDHFPLTTTYALDWSFAEANTDCRLHYHLRKANGAFFWCIFQEEADRHLVCAIVRDKVSIEYGVQSTEYGARAERGAKVET